MVGQSESLPMMMPTRGVFLFTALPIQLRWKEFSDQILIKRAQLRNVRLLMAFGIEIIRIESAHPLEHLLVFLVHEMGVFALFMSRVKGMIAQHVKGFFRQ